MTYLFVYGTLMRGQERHRLIADQTFIAAASTTPDYRLYDVGVYPALVEEQPGRCIAGEVWLVADERLALLDRAEGVDEGLYARRRVQLQPPHDGWNAQAYCYTRSVRGLADLGGSWLRRKA